MNRSPLPRSGPLSRGKGLERGAGPARRTPLRPASARRPEKAVPGPRRETRFPAAVKLKARARAGGGDVEAARCEACGKFLGRYGGQVQHRLARKAGGSRSPVVNGIGNAALLCGDPFTGCHGACERRDAGMRERGWWIRDGNGPECDPRFVPALLAVPGAGRRQVWLAADGTYSDRAPEVAA